ncbi:MAG: helix-turn-helix transcriptional regulator [Acutalibacteraceae bacterium]
MDPVKIGQKLTELRGALPPETVAESVGISVNALLMYEQGRRLPRSEIRIKLAEYYHEPVESIFRCSKIAHSVQNSPADR